MSNCPQNIVGYGDFSEIFALIVGFENCTLPPEKWTQNARMTVVFWYMSMNPLLTARRLIRDGIRRYHFEHSSIAGLNKNADTETFVRRQFRVVQYYLKHANKSDSFVDRTNGLFHYLGGCGLEEKDAYRSVYVAENISARSDKL